MKPKTTAELLVWCKKLNLDENQKEEVITYIGELEQILNEKTDLLEKFYNLSQKVHRPLGQMY